MSGPGRDAFLAVARIKTRFDDPLEVQPSVHMSGTGFWVKAQNGSLCFFTNKHNVDPTLKLGINTQHRLKAIQIELRDKSRDPFNTPSQFVDIVNISQSLINHETSDVSMLHNPQINSQLTYLSAPKHIDQYLIADQEFLANSSLPMDVASFIGFPGTRGVGWWDQRTNLPISRSSNLSSLPEMAFDHPHIPTLDAALVSGMSFSGSSGSPLFLHSKGIKLGHGLVGGNHVPLRVIGIMSGHWKEKQENEDMFFHTGLSYYTRSTSMLDLMNLI